MCACIVCVRRLNRQTGDSGRVPSCAVCGRVLVTPRVSGTAGRSSEQPAGIVVCSLRRSASCSSMAVDDSRRPSRRPKSRIRARLLKYDIHARRVCWCTLSVHASRTPYILDLCGMPPGHFDDQRESFSCFSIVLIVLSFLTPRSHAPPPRSTVHAPARVFLQMSSLLGVIPYLGSYLHHCEAKSSQV